METYEESSADGADEPPLNLSSGKLPGYLSAVVLDWRAELLRTRTRVKASHSDLVAVAVVALLETRGGRGPRPQDIAAAAITARRTKSTATEPAVGTYMLGRHARQYRELHAAAAEWSAARHAEVDERARDLGAAWAVARLKALGLAPHRDYRLPRGILVRMALEAWADRPARLVVPDAARYAEDVHLQAHRARRDARRP